MKHLSTLAALLITAASFAAPLTGAMAADAPAKLANGALVDAKGMTLYTFDKDVAGSGKSTCNGGCAALWPPAMAAASDQPAGAYTIVMRDDGARQWAYKGKPVYTYQADQDFLAMMIPHHAGAVDMARLVLQHGRDPVTRQLAEEIIAGQTVEIQSMQRRLHTLQQRTAKGAEAEFPSLGGTRGP